MARTDTSLQILDSLERIFALEVYHFDEESARSGCNKVSFKRHHTKVAIDFVQFSPKLQLTEENEGASLKRVVITNIHPETLVLKPDHFSVRFFKRGTYNKACDYLILTKYNGELYAIFIDLKSCLYEDQDSNNTVFKFEKEDDADIVWQMVGADAVLDECIDILTKKANCKRQNTRGSKKKAASHELCGFKRRYIILYGGIDKTGSHMPIRTSYRMPPINALEMPVHIMNVHNNIKIALGDLFSVGGLER